MSTDDYSLIALAETSTPYIKATKTRESKHSKRKYRKATSENEDSQEEKVSLLRRFPSLQSALRPNFRRFNSTFRKLSCFKAGDEEEIPIVEMPRHKSIDIGVGLARRVSLFLFTRRTVCVHPYHPYTPEQSTRKIYFGMDDK